jgi:hypothetical protein
MCMEYVPLSVVLIWCFIHCFVLLLMIRHDSLDNKVMLHWNASPLHFSDSFIKHLLDDYLVARRRKIGYFIKRGSNIKHGILYHLPPLC